MNTSLRIHKSALVASGILCFALCFAGTAAAQTPSPALLVVSKSASMLNIVDPASGKIVGRVPTGGGPHEVAASEDGKLAFVSNYVSGTSLSVIDIDAQKEVRRVPLDLRNPHGVWVHDGAVYFSAEGSQAIGRYLPDENRVDWTGKTGEQRTHMVVVHPNGRQIFTSNINSDSVTVFEGSGSNWAATTIPVGRGPEGLDLTPDGAQLWAAHSQEPGASIIDVATKKVVGRVDFPSSRINRLKFTPDGKTMLASDTVTGELFIVDVATKRLKKRLDLGQAATGILVRPDGSEAFVAMSNDDEIAVVDLAKLEEVRRFPVAGEPDGMAWVER